MKKKILLIDDSQEIHLMIGYILNGPEFKMKSAYDGAEGLSILQSFEPDLVILDYMMPGANGVQVFKDFISNPIYKKFQHVPFIMLTAKQTNKDDVDQMIKLGMSAFLYKPFGQKELINIIQNILVSQELQIKKKNLFNSISDAKEFLANLIENIPSALFIIDDQGDITFYNGGQSDVLEYSEDQVVNKPFKNLVGKEKENFEKSKELLNQKGNINNFEINLINKNGHVVPFSFSKASLRKNDKNEGLVLIGTDISETKRIESLLIEKEKIATLMETAVAVNHEINNPLSPILGNIQLLLENKELYDKNTCSRLEAIKRNALRIQEITQKLRKIKQPAQKKYLGDTQMLDIHHSN